jgi:hypothetical protein
VVQRWEEKEGVRLGKQMSEVLKPNKRAVSRERGILFFALLYLGILRFALHYIELSFLPHFTLTLHDLPLSHMQ